MLKLIPWAYLILASILEVCWIYSVKFLDLKKIGSISWKNLRNDYSLLTPLLPFIAYLFFGLTSAIFFSMSMKKIPSSTAFAGWMGLALVITKIVEIIWLKEPFSWSNVLFMLLILIGIIGLKGTTTV
jgi:quaternary ammonium compound-resistance protein SugE